MAEVVVEGVRKSFGRTEVLKGVSVAVADGEMMVVLGPSGCGKSTLLRLVAGLERADAGEIRIGPRRVNELEPKDRDIAMVFQNYALYPHMSVYDNMAYGLRNLGTPRPEIDRRVRAAAGALGLAELLQRKPRQLSGGQRQRVAMGRAIVREPEVFLFDEPLSNLDAALRVQMRLEVRQLQERLRTTGIFVTHDQVEAMTLGDRLLVLNAGLVEQVGAPLEVYARPASRFVAGFIGSPAMNFLAARLSPDGAAAVLADGTGLALPDPRPGEGGRDVVVGLRPEHLREGGRPGEPAPLLLAVESVEALGADTIVHGRLGGGEPLAARLDGSVHPRAGDRLPLAPVPGALHLFDPAGDGRRLPDRREGVPGADPVAAFPLVG
jgi:sn-glycerol 3-phosphate transport system ATP-binding protein